MDLSRSHKLQTGINVIALALQARVSFMLVGHPGSAKSSLIKAICKVLKKWLEVFEVPGKNAIHDVIGTPLKKPYRGPDGKSAEDTDLWCQDHVYLEYILNARANPGSVIFFDDIADTPYQMQALYLALMGPERKFGNLRLTETSVCAAANPRGATLEMKHSLLNRCLLIPWNPDHHDMNEAMRNNFPAPKVPVVDPKWEEKFLPERLAEVATFLDQTPNILIPDADEGVVKMSESFPSRRTWTMVAMLLAAYDAATFEGEKLSGREELLILVKGMVGDVAATAYFTWKEQMRLPETKDILDNPLMVAEPDHDLLGERIDRLFVMLTKMSGYVIRLGDTDEGVQAWYNAWKVLGVLAENDRKGFASTTMLAMLNNRPSRCQNDPDELALYADVIAANADNEE